MFVVLGVPLWVQKNYSVTITVVYGIIQELSPLLPKALDMSVADEESMDGPSSVDQSFNDACSYQGDSVAENTPTSSKRKKVIYASAPLGGANAYNVLQSIFCRRRRRFPPATTKCINMRQPFLRTAELIFMKLLPNDSGEM